jgi:hypothetical protein
MPTQPTNKSFDNEFVYFDVHSHNGTTYAKLIAPPSRVNNPLRSFESELARLAEACEPVLRVDLRITDDEWIGSDGIGGIIRPASTARGRNVQLTTVVGPSLGRLFREIPLVGRILNVVVV